MDLPRSAPYTRALDLQLRRHSTGSIIINHQHSSIVIVPAFGIPVVVCRLDVVAKSLHPAHLPTYPACSVVNTVANVLRYVLNILNRIIPLVLNPVLGTVPGLLDVLRDVLNLPDLRTALR